jgi:hypothetical protein
MLTRGAVTHQYGYAGYYAEPYHVLMLEDAYPVAGTREVARYAQIPLNPLVMTSGLAGFRPYLGMDPSDPGTWQRPFNPQPGMFTRLHQDQAAGRAAEPARKRKGMIRRG